MRVVLFGSGPVVTHDARRFLSRLEAHPEISLVGGFFQADGSSLTAVWRDLSKRRGLLAAPLFLAWIVGGMTRWTFHPRAELALRRDLRELRDRLHFVEDIHSPEVLSRLEALAPDLGLIYGSPILRPELFEIPKLGTLGIHHGQLPEYRGNKTTFWAMVNGESAAGVTIQKVNAGLDTGQIVEQGRVLIGRRSQRAVWRDLENLGLSLYLRAILRVWSGDATYRPQLGPKGKLYRNPKIGDLLRFRRRRLRQLLGLRGSEPPTSRLGGRNGSPAGGDANGLAGPRILIFTETFHPVVGGGETQARLLAEGLHAADLPARVLTRRSDPNLPRVELVGDIVVHRIAPVGSGQLKKWGLVISGLWALLGLRREYDAVYVSGFRIAGIPTVLVGRLLGKPVILKADSQGEMSGRFFDAGLARFGLSPSFWPFRVLLLLRNRLLKGADAFVAITDGVTDELREASVDHRKVHHIPNAVDVSRFSPVDETGKEQLRQRLGLPESDPIVTYTGRLVSYKGLPLLCRVWEEIHAVHDKARLLLIGSGGLDIHNCEAELKASVAQMGLERHVLFTGSVENVEEYLQASDVFVLPSENEALPCSLLEAMACGLPVIATPVGAIPSFLHDDFNGLLVEPGDFESLHHALLRLLEGPELSARLADEARRTVESGFSADLVTRKLLALFAQAGTQRLAGGVAGTRGS